jgi:dipeptidyl-peptidase-4
VHTWSSFGTPPTVELITLPDHRRVRVLQENAPLRTRLAALEQGPREFFRVDIGNGVKLDGWMIKPPGFDPSKKYPVLFYVWRAASQTVVDSWGGGNFMWHLMLSEMGYIVVSVDNRGTPAPRGREWRKAIYGKIGVLNGADQAAAAQAIAKWPFVDAQRLGVWGWSGGGATTLNVMFRTPDVYRMGMSVAPVTDLHYYDTIYQERYVGLPQENAEAYRLGSPVTFASQLKGDLLVVHGSGDDNVHYQNTEALVNALVQANKPFQMMAYPNRTHCICEGQGTSLHLYSLLTRYLREHLPAPSLSRHNRGDVRQCLRQTADGGELKTADGRDGRRQTAEERWISAVCHLPAAVCLVCPLPSPHGSCARMAPQPRRE